MGINSFSLELSLASRLSFNQPLLLKGFCGFFFGQFHHKSLNFVDSGYFVLSELSIDFFSNVHGNIKRYSKEYPGCQLPNSLPTLESSSRPSSLKGINLCLFVEQEEGFQGT